MELTFTYRGEPVTLSSGQLFSRPPTTSFSDADSQKMRDIVANVRAGTPWRQEIDDRFGSAKPWLRDIILSPQRQKFFDILPATAERILDIGCGWGQMTLPLAAAGREVVAVEPGQDRLAFVKAAAEQDKVADRIAFVGADFLDCEFPRAFDAVLSIGVLEWIGAFHEATDPQDSQRRFLASIRRQLKAGGALVLGIENRLGAKYLLGCPDDHLGVANIGCLPAPQAAARWKATTGAQLRCFTYSELELRAMLRAAGFNDLQFFGAFPDYKLPEIIVPLRDPEVVATTLLNDVTVVEHNGFDGSRLPDEMQERIRAFYRDSALQKIAHHFVPSFFVLAT